MSPKSVHGFNVIGIRFCAASKVCHELFVKEHSVRTQSDNKPEGHTLLALNVPPYATEDSIKRAFSSAGNVKHVIFQDKPSNIENPIVKTIKGFKVAYVVFEKSKSIRIALNLTELNPLSSDTHPVVTGLEKWAKEYNDNIYDYAKLQQGVTLFMAVYDKQQKKAKQQEKDKDDWGWTVVGKKGRHPGMSRKESVVNKIAEKTNKGAKRKYLDDFYTFQKRESKMKHVEEMRKKYEQDKKKVEAMKQARKFKPF